MPIFEYSCLGCKEKFERLLLGNHEEIECPICGGKNVEKLFSTFSFKSEGNFSSSATSSGCSSCTSSSCATCHN
ncbi:MAG: zinc ribbon domain-containing protein [Thermodesulfobacteriota bacterium]|nr:zinc ribbon domain-containing protein [Thermodesulfobacteriota bacterium]